MTNRRNFVKQAAAVMAMAAMPGVIQSASEEREKGLTLKRSQIKVDDQWDVIIVGGGPAGCTAAIAAAREGAKTLLIEAMGQLGGMGQPEWFLLGVRFPMVKRLYIKDLLRKFLENR